MNEDKRRLALGMVALTAAMGVIAPVGCSHNRSMLGDVAVPESPRVYNFELQLDPDLCEVESGDFRLVGEGEPIPRMMQTYDAQMRRLGWSCDRYEVSESRARVGYWKEPDGKWADARVCLLAIDRTNVELEQVSGLVRVGKRGEVEITDSEVRGSGSKKQQTTDS